MQKLQQDDARMEHIRLEREKMIKVSEQARSAMAAKREAYMKEWEQTKKRQ